MKKRLNSIFRDCYGLEVVENAIKDVKETVYRADFIFYDINRRIDALTKHGITVIRQHYCQRRVQDFSDTICLPLNKKFYKFAVFTFRFLLVGFSNYYILRLWINLCNVRMTRIRVNY